MPERGEPGDAATSEVTVPSQGGTARVIIGVTGCKMTLEESVALPWTALDPKLTFDTPPGMAKSGR